MFARNSREALSVFAAVFSLPLHVSAGADSARAVSTAGSLGSNERSLSMELLMDFTFVVEMGCL